MNKDIILETKHPLKMLDMDHLNMNIKMSYLLIISQLLINLNQSKLDLIAK